MHSTENVTKQQTCVEEIYWMSFSFIYSGGAQMNRKLLEARPLKYTIDILLQVWFHLMGYVVHVYWLEVNQIDLVPYHLCDLTCK